jgi:hypothetical protein
MAEPTPLDYGKAEGGSKRQLSGMAIAGLVVGLCGGPVGFAVCVIDDVAERGGVGPKVELVGLVGVPLAALVFCIVAFRQSVSVGNSRGWIIALVGILAAIFWAMCLIGWHFEPP